LWLNPFSSAFILVPPRPPTDSSPPPSWISLISVSPLLFQPRILWALRHPGASLNAPHTLYIPFFLLAGRTVREVVTVLKLLLHPPFLARPNVRLGFAVIADFGCISRRRDDPPSSILLATYLLARPIVTAPILFHRRRPATRYSLPTSLISLVPKPPGFALTCKASLSPVRLSYLPVPAPPTIISLAQKSKH